MLGLIKKLLCMLGRKTVRCNPVIFDDVLGNGNVPIFGQKPYYATKYAACADLAVPRNVVVQAGKAVKINMLIGFMIPKGYKLLMYPRSSLLIKKGLIQPTSVIDQDYSGQPVHVPLFNPGAKDVTIVAGERVAQIECVPVYECRSWAKSSNTRNKVDGAFGSTGGN